MEGTAVDRHCVRQRKRAARHGKRAARHRHGLGGAAAGHGERAAVEHRSINAVGIGGIGGNAGSVRHAGFAAVEPDIRAVTCLCCCVGAVAAAIPAHASVGHAAAVEMKDAVRVHLHSVVLLVKFAAVHGKRAVEHAHAAAAEIPAGVVAVALIRICAVAGHGAAVHGKHAAAVHIHRAAAVIQGERFILVGSFGAVAADDAAVHHERAAVHIHRAALGVELTGILGAGGVVLLRRCYIGRITGKGSAVHGEFRILRHIHRVAEVGLIAGNIAAVQVDLGTFRHPDRAAVIVDFLRCVVVHRLSFAAGDLAGADAVADVQRAALHMDAAIV